MRNPCKSVAHDPLEARPDPKPKRRVRRRGAKRTLRSQVHDPEASLRRMLRERECRIPGCGRPPGGCHHLVPKGSPHFGDDVEENLIPLCGSGTTGHHGLVEAHEAATCAALGRALSPENVAYVLRRLGESPGLEFLRRRYGYRPEEPVPVNGDPPRRE